MSILLAFSGGLDTSFCVPFLADTTGEPVVTVTVDTGGLEAGAHETLSAHSAKLGARAHHTVDGRAQLFADHLAYLIKGNVLRGGVYPLCVGPERVVQARAVADLARTIGATAIAHGSTGAGNDQIRFDVALRVLADGVPVIAPVREHGLTREYMAGYLAERGHSFPASRATYSINRGLWGTTIGGKETHTTHLPLPEDAYPDTAIPSAAPAAGVVLQISFKQGVPIALDGQSLDGVALVEALNEIGGHHGIGRGIHVGDTILGIKGRVGFEAPAAIILINAHRELEKIVLSRWQQFQKDQQASFYGMLLHEGQYFDPVMRDIEAFLDSSQQRVTGTVEIELRQGRVSVLGATSPFSLFDTGVAAYGETNALWDGRDAEGFARLYALQGYLAHRAALPSTSTTSPDL
jgi:argininosuccinate synthase